MTPTKGPILSEMSREARLARAFVELSDTLIDDFDVIDLLTLLAERCAQIFETSGVGVLLADPRGHLRVIAATSDALETVELFQTQNDEGPCRDWFRYGQPVIADDLSVEHSRWPAFVPVALGAGLHWVHAFPLRLRQRTLGSLGVFGAEPAPLQGDDVAMAQALADVATIAVLHQGAMRETTAVADQLQRALDSRVVIEQAKGVLAERSGLDMADAFAALRRYARTERLLLSDVAADVVSGQLRIGELESRQR